MRYRQTGTYSRNCSVVRFRCSRRRKLFVRYPQRKEYGDGRGWRVKRVPYDFLYQYRSPIVPCMGNNRYDIARYWILYHVYLIDSMPRAVKVAQGLGHQCGQRRADGEPSGLLALPGRASSNRDVTVRYVTVSVRLWRFRGVIVLFRRDCDSSRCNGTVAL